MERDILDMLRDLHEQATKERSHYYVASASEKAIAEIIRLRMALVQVTDCYVDRFGGHVIGLRSNTAMHLPCEIARAALNGKPSPVGQP